MALSDLTETLNDRFFFSTDFFGEVWSYDPAGEGAARDVTVIVTEEKPATVDEDYCERSRDAIWVTVRRDAGHADGGIDSPAIDDVMANPDDASNPYSFQNQIKNRTTDRWTLLFARDRPEAYRPR